MEAATFSPLNLRLRFFDRKFFGLQGGPAKCSIPSGPFLYREANLSLLNSHLNSLRRQPVLVTRHPSSIHRKFYVHCSDQSPTNSVSDNALCFQSSHPAPLLVSSGGGADLVGLQEGSEFNASAARPKSFGNRFLNFARLGSVVSDAAEAFFKSEIRRRLFVTAVLIIVSRIGYFIPLPGFDRRMIPEDYLSFASGSVGTVPHHSISSETAERRWWISLGFAMLEAVIVACYSLQYSIYAASQRFKHVMVTSFLLVLGAMSMTWICDTITESGFGQGSSLIICAGILTGYTDTLYKMLSQFSGNALSWWPYILAILGIFTVVTMWAVLVTEGCRKIKLQYYAFKLASATRNGGSPVTEVEPYIPFNINPTGMQPVLTATYLLAFPSIMASIFGSPFWGNLKEILNPGTSIGAEPWVFYAIYAFFVFLFNIFDIANLPKEIADYMTKMGARIPNIKPGKATVEHLTKIQASTRFWGGLLLSLLATSSTLLDHYLRRINEGFAVGFTSVLIIVGSIIELRRSYQAYNVMPSLSKVLRRYGV